MSGLSRVADAFEAAQADGRAALVAYLVAGYPDLGRSEALVREAAAAGVDVIELGIPFSDPVADGPTIQRAITKSLEGGTRPSDVLAMVRRLRRDGVTTPVLAMTYANLFYAPGWDVSAKRLRRAGVDGTIVPDVPLEESAEYRQAWRKQGLASVLLATPATTDDRLARIAQATSGFLYLVAVHGTTGARATVADETKRLLRRVARVGHRTPACVGFGVSKPAHVRTLKKEGADGVVVGSAIVDRIAGRRSVRAYLSELRRAT